ncbi:MAG: M1 family aminopeptidase [Candidatus Bipolaricaulia bacterium]
MTMRTGLALALSLALLGGAAAYGGSIPSQRVEATYHADHHELSGTLEITFAEAPGTVYFLLLPNLDREPNPYLSPRAIDAVYPEGFTPSGLDVFAVNAVDDGVRSPATYRLLAMPPAFQTYGLDEVVLAVDAASPTIEIRFATSVPRIARGDGGLTNGTFTWRFGWFPLLVENDGAYVERDGVLFHGEGEAFPLLLPLTEIEGELSLPADVRVYAGADHVETAATPDGDGSRPVRLWNESPTRSLAVTFGAGYEEYTLDGPTPIRVAYLGNHANTARLLATYARDVLAEFEARYGAYPRSGLSIVENPNTLGDAFSADGIVWLSSRFFTHRDVLLPEVLHRLTEYVLAHEIAHQWFGVGMGVDLDAEGWLSEGLAQYASVAYFERAYGAADPNLIAARDRGVLEEVVARQFGYLNLREHLIELPYLASVWSAFDEALVKPASELDYANESATRLYDKGYLVARALAAAVGEETLDRALRRAVAAGRAAQIDSARLRALVEEEAGRSLEEWFDAWVFGAGSVDYAVRIAERITNADAYETTAAVTRNGGTAQDVEVEATMLSGAAVRLTWDGVDAEGLVTFRTPSPVVRVVVDPDHRLPDRDRINNHAPVRIVAAVSRAAYPLDAYVISPTSSGGVVLSRLDRFELGVEEDSASLVIRRGRDLEFSAAAGWSSAGIVGGVACAVTRYEPAETGAPGTTWEAAQVLSAGAYRLASQGEPFYVARMAAVRLPSVTSSRIAAASVDLISGASGRLSLAAFDELRVFPGMYLQGTGFLGFSAGGVPQSLLFDWSELVSVAPAPAPNKLSASLAFEFPSAEGLPYNAFNLAMIDGLCLRVFVSGGVGWTSADGFGTTSASVEAGIEEEFDLSTLGGLVSFSVRIGVAVPITGEAVPALYAGFSL